MSNERTFIPRCVSLPPTLVEQLEDIAEVHDVSVSQIVRIALFHYLNGQSLDVYKDPYSNASNTSTE
jgi:metal-responsive CopG/Arc/MetJ family transcriptional regulator